MPLIRTCSDVPLIVSLVVKLVRKGIEEEKKEKKVATLYNWRTIKKIILSFMFLSFFFCPKPLSHVNQVCELVCVHERNRGMFGLFAGC